MQQTQHPSRRAWRRRALSFLLALVLTLGLVPGFPLVSGQAAEAHWADGYLNQLVEWGFIRADQANRPDAQLTRADFMSITNRAYGYDEVGPTPFTDVSEYDWYYDDVGIAYNARYINGTSPTTASPNDTLDRETATTILGRNMMLQESAGEILDFTDARNISNWARGTIKSSLEHYLVSGYEDGSFRPQQAVSWGEMAALIARTVGTPLQEAGDYSLGGVFGNVTITADGVTLRDSVISGDLYVTGGVGLGGVKLENVTVLGRIIASGTGRSEDGSASILLRNVTADELLVDNLQDNDVSVRADGITEIGKTTVRTSAYIEDTTPDGMGLHLISLEGETYPDGEAPEGWTPPELTLAGRIEEVVNRTPGSTVHAAKGTVAKMTIHEEAANSQVIIDRNTKVSELNLDTATTVTGEGDIGKLVVNAPGCIVSMLPDEIEIRPGITAVINGQVMDSTDAEEASLEPMILAGYPQATDIAPTSITALFSTNKRGTIYWAVSAIADGSVGEEDLIKPPAYGSIAVQRGSLTSPRGNEEVTAAVAGLQPDGSYYLSAVLVDDRGQRSPTKVISFTTPDNTVPAFNQGYPYMSMTSRTNSQAVVSANKSCILYYALYPQGVTAPTANDLKAAAVTGSLGYGVQTLDKNTEFSFQVNDRTLEEQKNYTVYFWLTDFNGANSSAVTSLNFTTADETPPHFLDGYPQVESFNNNSVTLKFRINEDGRVFWVVRPEGDQTYPQPEPGQTGTAPLDSLFAKTQVSAENPAIAARADTDGRIVINNLQPETAYDLYYLCQDNAGNYALRVEKMIIHTADSQGPYFVRQYFGTEETSTPKADDDICLEFSENLCSTGSVQTDFLSLYQSLASGDQSAVANFVAALKESIILYRMTPNGPVRVKDPTEDEENWGIDYSNVKVEKTGDGHLKLTFPATGSSPAVRLTSGSTYHFVFTKLTDNAQPQKNPMVDAETNQRVNEVVAPDFTIDFATIALSDQPNLKSDEEAPQQRDKTTGQPVTETVEVPKLDANGNQMKDDQGNLLTEEKKVPVLVTMDDKAIYFRMTPEDTSNINEIISYDLLLWADQTVSYQLYYRILDKDDGEKVVTSTRIHQVLDDEGEETSPANGLSPGKADDAAKAVDDNGWIYLGNPSVETQTGNWKASSLHRDSKMNNYTQNQFPRLRSLGDDLVYEFVIVLTKVGVSEEPDTWSGTVNFWAQVVAGNSAGLYNWAGGRYTAKDDAPDMTEFETAGVDGGGGIVISTGFSPLRYLELETTIGDSKVPYFRLNTPQFPATLADGSKGITDNKVTLRLALDRKDTEIYYVLGKADTGEGDPEFPTTVPAYVLDEDGNPVQEPIPVYVQQDRDATTGELKFDDAAKTKPTYKKDGSGNVIVVGKDETDKDPVPYKDTNGNQYYYTTTDGTYTTNINDTNIKKEKVRNPYGLADATPVMVENQLVIPVDIAKVPTQGDSTGLPLFKLVEPFQDHIFDPENWEAMTTDLYGTIPYPGGRTIDVPVTGLDPSTTYYAYFLLKGKSSPKSEVYVYKFTTTAEEKPRIKLSPAKITPDSNATPGDMVVQTHIASTGKYWVFATGAQISLLNQDFSNVCYTETEIGEILGVSGNTKKVPAIYRKTGFTVLDALTTQYRSTTSGLDSATEYVPAETGTGYSVFDFYADSQVRNDLYWLIYSPPADVGTKASDSLTIGEPTGNGLREEDWGKFDIAMNLPEHDENRYYLVTYAVSAHNTYQPGEEAKVASFSAKRFGRGDLPQPEVDAVDFTIREGAPGTYSGTITVSFKQAVRLHNMNGEAQEMTMENLLKGLYGYNVNLPQNGDVKVAADPGNSSFQLSFENVPGSSSLSFESNYFANLDNEGAPKRLVITWEENTREKTGWAVARWGGVEVGRSNTVYLSETPNNLSLNFSGLALSGDKYSLTLDGKETPTPYTRTVKGTLNGLGTIFHATVSPVSANSVLANPTISVTSGEISLTFVGKAIGTNEDFTVTASVEDANGNTVQVKRVITVSVIGAVKIDSFTPSDNTSTFTPAPTDTNNSYSWNRADNGRKTATMVISSDKNIVDLKSVSVVSAKPNSLSIESTRLDNGKISVILRYLSKADGSSDVTIKIGNLERTITITLDGVSDSGTNATTRQTIGKNPY